jgi:hypothetical protein
MLSRSRARVAASVPVPVDLAPRLDEVGALLAPLARGRQLAWAETLAGADDVTLRTAALWAHREVCAASHAYANTPAHDLLTALSRRKLAWTPEEVIWAARLTHDSVRGESADLAALARLPVSSAERLSPAQRWQLRDLFAPLRDLAADERMWLMADERRRLLRRLDALLTDPAQTAGPVSLPPNLLHDGDALGPAVRAEFGPRLEAAGVPALLVHAASASSPRPAARWLATGRGLLEATDDGAGLLRALLERALAHRETATTKRWEGEEYSVFEWVHESTGRLLRGAVLLVGGVDEPWVTPLLGDLAVYVGGGNGGSSSSPRDLVVANAAVAALARRDDAVPHLARAQTRLTHRGVLKVVTAGLEAAAARVGLSRSELLETAVPTYGLDASGCRAEQLGEHTAELAVAAPGTVTLTFRDATGKRLSGVPAAVKAGHADRLAGLRAEVKELKKTVATERARVESLLAEDRSWSLADWGRLYRDHPLVGRLTRGLLWQAGDGQAWSTGRLQDVGVLAGLDGSVVTGERVRLWHPATAPAEEVRAWRSVLLDSGERQPFKQAFREVYLLTPAEVETGDHSNRFAAHVLRAPQAQALMRVRGWTGSALGYWDGGYDGHVTREFGDWRAEFFFDLIEVDADGYGIPSLAGSDQVRFARREDGGWAARPLAEVSPLVFTEAMRDVDLFIGVTSIAADPTWVTRGARDHETYWRRVGFGELGESAQIRREALERLVPRLAIADRCTLTDRYLVVRGNVRTYKVHIGSANILMEPNDEYLCIVPGRGDRGPKVFLPFEEDGGVLSVVLSKAFLLAADDRITDSSITSQIRRG